MIEEIKKLKLAYGQISPMMIMRKFKLSFEKSKEICEKIRKQEVRKKRENMQKTRLFESSINVCEDG